MPGRELKGIHFAMEFLPQQNKRERRRSSCDSQILATGKRVIIIGGGDTGADCLGTSHRQKAQSVTSSRSCRSRPNDARLNTPWPLWPLQLRIESSHEEGGVREWASTRVKFTATRTAT